MLTNDHTNIGCVCCGVRCHLRMGSIMRDIAYGSYELQSRLLDLYSNSQVSPLRTVPVTKTLISCKSPRHYPAAFPDQLQAIHRAGDLLRNEALSTFYTAGTLPGCRKGQVGCSQNYGPKLWVLSGSGLYYGT